MEGSMRILSGALTLALLLATVPVVWAQTDAAKEIADINRKRAQAGAKGDADTFLADVADNAVFTVARAGFRIEGKEAIRAVSHLRGRQRRCRQRLYRPDVRRPERQDEHADAAEQPDVGQDCRSLAAG
jgi:hypothetical protein